MSANTTIENYLYHINKIKEESTDVEIVAHAAGLLDCGTNVPALVEYVDIVRDEDECQDARALNYIKRCLIELCSTIGATNV